MYIYTKSHTQQHFVDREKTKEGFESSSNEKCHDTALILNDKTACLSVPTKKLVCWLLVAAVAQSIGTWAWPCTAAEMPLSKAMNTSCADCIAALSL